MPASVKLSLIVIPCFSCMADKKNKLGIFFWNTSYERTILLVIKCIFASFGFWFFCRRSRQLLTLDMILAEYKQLPEFAVMSKSIHVNGAKSLRFVFNGTAKKCKCIKDLMFSMSNIMIWSKLKSISHKYRKMFINMKIGIM